MRYILTQVDVLKKIKASICSDQILLNYDVKSFYFYRDFLRKLVAPDFIQSISLNKYATFFLIQRKCRVCIILLQFHIYALLGGSSFNKTALNTFKLIAVE